MQSCVYVAVFNRSLHSSVTPRILWALQILHGIHMIRSRQKKNKTVCRGFCPYLRMSCSPELNNLRLSTIILLLHNLLFLCMTTQICNLLPFLATYKWHCTMQAQQNTSNFTQWLGYHACERDECKGEFLYLQYVCRACLISGLESIICNPEIHLKAPYSFNGSRCSLSTRKRGEGFFP